MKITPRTLFLTVSIVGSTSLQAQSMPECSYVGQEFCIKGKVYRCEKTGSEITPIFTNGDCVVSAQTIEGTWHGTVHQSPAGESSNYPVVMVISAGGGSIDYPTLGCGGSLTRLSGGNTSAQFRENITHGGDRCINGGTISVNLSQGSLSWSYRGQQEGQTYTGSAMLERR